MKDIIAAATGAVPGQAARIVRTLDGDSVGR